jgi:DNA-binding response OmpR family regulator
VPTIRVLIVEDDVVMRAALRSILRKDGYEVDAAESGEEALVLLRDADYDLLITDLRLPGISGLDVLRTVKETGANIGMIMITAYASADSAVMAMKAGADDYLPKPFELPEIRLAVRKVLEKRNLLPRTNLCTSN